jgi:hypothetical protein
MARTGRPRTVDYDGSGCSEPGCQNPYYGHGLCRSHYNERRHEWQPPCSFEGCDKPVHARNLCVAHYRRQLNNGDPAVVKVGGTKPGTILSPLEDRFWAKVDKRGPDECWLWTGATYQGPPGSGLYGKLGAGGKHGKTLCAHRVAYELQVGPIPPGFEVDHLCFVTLCQNGAHLEAVPPGENQRRAVARQGRIRTATGRFQRTVP